MKLSMSGSITPDGAMANTGKPSATNASGPCRKSALLYGSTDV